MSININEIDLHGAKPQVIAEMDGIPVMLFCSSDARGFAVVPCTVTRMINGMPANIRPTVYVYQHNMGPLGHTKVVYDPNRIIRYAFEPTDLLRQIGWSGANAALRVHKYLVKGNRSDTNIWVYIPDITDGAAVHDAPDGPGVRISWQEGYV
jgi:hypothetical protein